MDQGAATSLNPKNKMMEELNRLDQSFINVFNDLVRLTQEGASQCTESIFQLSAAYMKREIFESLQKFYDLYFSHSSKQQRQKEAINAAVDDMFDAASNAVSRGENHEAIQAYVQDNKLAAERLAAASLQKQLEGLIVLDQGIRNEILPALSSMQFEDATRQRLAHISSGWEKLVEFVQKLSDPSYFSSWPPEKLAIQLRDDLEEILRGMAKLTSSIKETEDYYSIVLKTPVPEDVAKGQESGDILLF
jgi:hypothetical protein